jgi:MFS family permease
MAEICMPSTKVSACLFGCLRRRPFEWVCRQSTMSRDVTTFADLGFSLDTGVIGPVTTMPVFVVYFGELSSTMHGMVVSTVLLSATFASLFAGSLSDTMGRTRAVSIGSAVFALGAALEAGASNLGMLITGRFIVGIGEGLFLSTLVV